MKINQAERLDGSDSDVAVIAAYFRDGEFDGFRNRIGEIAGLDEARRRGELNGDLYNVAVFRGRSTLALVGLGKEQDLELLRFLRAVGAGSRVLNRSGFSRLAVLLDTSFEPSVAATVAINGVVSGTYDAGLLKTGKREKTAVDSLTLVGPTVDEAIIQRALVTADSARFARDLVNLPAGDLTPTTFADRLKTMASEVGIKCRVLGQQEITDIGMGAILGVAKGSSEPPCVIDLRYGDESAATRLAFVGKGLTFDSGGLSLKTADGMETMKCDMGGAAAVAGAMRAIGTLKPEGVYIRGLIGAVENMPGPAAMKPGDVLRTLNGKTIEVLNTDAEGRLVLSDLLAYAVQGGATNIVDLATLTGAAVIALGHEAAMLVGRPQSWIDRVRDAGDAATERLWQLPLYPEYRERMDSYLADMKNTGGRPGGALTASSLLAEFVDNVPWAHLDIAGTAFDEAKTAYGPKGGTGFGVATLVQLAFAARNGATT